MANLGANCGKLIGENFRLNFPSHEIHKYGVAMQNRTAAGHRPIVEDDFLIHYPHFYPQAEPPPFGYSRCHSVHNPDGDIFVHNRGADGQKMGRGGHH